MYAFLVSSSTRLCNLFMRPGNLCTTSIPFWFEQIFFRTSEAIRYPSSLFLGKRNKKTSYSWQWMKSWRHTLHFQFKRQKKTWATPRKWFLLIHGCQLALQSNVDTGQDSGGLRVHALEPPDQACFDWLSESASVNCQLPQQPQVPHNISENTL